MATLFLAFSPSREPLNLTEATWEAVREAMGERCPGTLKKFISDSFCCLVGGEDGHVVEAPDLFLVADGHPLPSEPNPRYSGRPTLEGLANAWRKKREAILPGLDGSFAFCVIDPSTPELTLVRDPFGSRPLLWTEWKGRVFVASECKILVALGIPLSISREALQEVLVYRWITGNQHLLDPLRQVPQASVVKVREGPVVEERRYWRFPFEPEENGDGAIARYRDLAEKALQESIADVAGGREGVGVLLSGGVDSSVLAALTRKTVGRCIGFAARISDSPNIELDRALLVARHLGIECQVVDVPGPRYGEDLRAMVRRIEEPPRHPNNVVLEALLQRASSEVDLVLHGEGAEMVFGLADTKTVERFRRKHEVVTHLPPPLRASLAGWLRATESSLAERLAHVLLLDPMTYGVLIDRIRYSIPVQRILRHLLEEPSSPRFLPLDHFEAHSDFSDALHAFQAHTYLTPTLLRYDRLAKPLGLTCESPFLRKPVVNFGCRIPRALRFTHASRPILRSLCDLHFPQELSRWPKLGFPVPWKVWLKRARLPIPLPDEKIARVLPGGFQETAVAEGDAEAIWTAATLALLMEDFGVNGSSTPGETLIPDLHRREPQPQNPPR
jgi:asparagine synthase (glutamine-hydrolysing)